MTQTIETQISEQTNEDYIGSYCVWAGVNGWDSSDKAVAEQEVLLREARAAYQRAIARPR